MKSNCNVRVDGKYYNVGQEYPDLGSLVCTSNNHGIREYEGLAKDADKLPTGNMESYKDMKTGSTFMATDSDLYKKYDASTCEWYEK